MFGYEVDLLAADAAVMLFACCLTFKQRERERERERDSLTSERGTNYSSDRYHVEVNRKEQSFLCCYCP